MKEHKLLIKGKWQGSEEIREIQSPYDQNPVAKVHFASTHQMEEAVAAADDAFAETKKLSSLERSQALEKISSGIDKRKEELARSIALSSGKTIKSSRIEVERAVNTFKIASEEAKRIGGDWSGIFLLVLSAPSALSTSLSIWWPIRWLRPLLPGIQSFSDPRPRYPSHPCFSARSSTRQITLPEG